MTGNPYTVFGCEDINPTIDLENLEFSGTMQDTNLIIIAEALDISYNEAIKLGALWIYHFNNINQGERYIPELASLIGVDPQSVPYLISKFVCTTNTDDIVRNIRNYLTHQLEELKFSLNNNLDVRK